MLSAHGDSFAPGPRATVTRERVADQIIHRLRHDIVSGTLPRGGQLPAEREMAATFGVSTATVREAVRALSSIGLLEVRHGSGAYVAQDSQCILDTSLSLLVQWESVSILDLVELMRTLILHAADIAVESADDDDVCAVRAAAEASATVVVPTDLNWSVTKFLVAFVACSHNPLLQAICGFLTRMVVSLESGTHADHPIEYWREWAGATSKQRIDIACALDERNIAVLREQISTFHDTIESHLVASPPTPNGLGGC
ncbi:GntR family transcriptional repressor for pyruvate dehydrogenase complex [Rhodococcus sp. 27YEA15]|uniref:FadR/GntR family transcriptional regulator n=1 Tax=Rhodococcus sp. 27YEA15 TaxID=3156259 RepID=UPI003C7B9FD6